MAGYSALQLLNLAAGMALGIFLVWINYRLIRVLQHSIWKKFIRLPMTVLDSLNPSSLPSRITSDVSSLGDNIAYAIQVITSTYRWS